jgi:hypothetical protein
MLEAIMEHSLYENEQGLRLIKAIQLQIVFHINQNMQSSSDIASLKKLFYLHQTCPILQPELLTLMMKVGPILADRRLIERKASYFTNWNLQMLDLENIEDPECISALDDCIFERILNKYSNI